MPTYLSLITYTQEGISKIKESPIRLEKAKEVFRKYGGELQQFYWAMGRYDAVVISQAPSDETAMRASLVIAGAGAVRTETLRIFNEAECREIIAELP